MKYGFKKIIKNKYFNWYIKIIENAKKRNTLQENYEIHHILPKSLGGLNNKQNLVKLTFREHFIVHILITKFTKNKDKIKMNKAVILMSGFHNRKIKTNSHTYSNIKKQYIKDSSKFWKYKYSSGQIISPFTNAIVHKKTIDKRTKNGTNIFETNNPMYNIESIKKKVAKTSGKNHYFRKRVKYYWKNTNSSNWEEIIIETNLQNYLTKMNWNHSSFWKILYSQKPLIRGAMKNILIKREYINEN